MLIPIFTNIFVIMSTAFALMLIRGLKSADEFRFHVWIRTNYNRFFAGGILCVLIPVILAVSQDASALFEAVGFNSTKAPISIGAAIAAILLTTVNPNKPKIIDDPNKSL